MTAPESPAELVPAELLEILACPSCRASLRADETGNRLVCNGCGLAYPVRDGIPVLLIDEAVASGDGPAPADAGS